MENQTKQSLQLLAELDALIEKDYQEALELIEMFRQETLEFRENNISENKKLLESLDIENSFYNFDSDLSESNHEKEELYGKC
jgi:hypothetical protein